MSSGSVSLPLHRSTSSPRRSSIRLATRHDTDTGVPNAFHPRDSLGAATSTVAQNQDNESEAPIYARWQNALQRPTADREEDFAGLRSSYVPLNLGSTVFKDDLLAMVPPTACSDYLVSEFFMRISPLFHILHGPTFEAQYSEHVANPSQSTLSWLALLFIVCALAVNTLEVDDPVLNDLWPKVSNGIERSTFLLAQHLRNQALFCLSQDQFLIHYDITSLESLLLLVYAISHNEGVERG
ncbi:hypothetical protein H2198_008161 [Neophaeococcomyces mojaviensis]|uniref:Uncharacterized protein n=1 Tax=Neophaeococcomyces mojaviensis TaxID=3383035 RepID=A0ACC2ZYC2_9EURO|nr:hypothetical protein H2198_008161 [Knufia sp. JES_112]